MVKVELLKPYLIIELPIKLKGKFYRMSIRPTMLYASECFAIKRVWPHAMYSN